MKCFLLYLIPVVHHLTAKVSQKTDMSSFGLIMVRDVWTKIGPLGDILRTLFASWVNVKLHKLKIRLLIMLNALLLLNLINLLAKYLMQN